MARHYATAICGGVDRALSILGVAASATPAAAKISEHGTEHRSFINVYENYCGDMTVRIDLEDDVMVMNRSMDPTGWSTQ